MAQFVDDVAADASGGRHADDEYGDDDDDNNNEMADFIVDDPMADAFANETPSSDEGIDTGPPSEAEEAPAWEEDTAPAVVTGAQTSRRVTRSGPLVAGFNAAQHIDDILPQVTSSDDDDNADDELEAYDTSDDSAFEDHEFERALVEARSAYAPAERASCWWCEYGMPTEQAVNTDALNLLLRTVQENMTLMEPTEWGTLIARLHYERIVKPCLRRGVTMRAVTPREVVVHFTEHILDPRGTAIQAIRSLRNDMKHIESEIDEHRANGAHPPTALYSQKRATIKCLAEVYKWPVAKMQFFSEDMKIDSERTRAVVNLSKHFRPTAPMRNVRNDDIRKRRRARRRRRRALQRDAHVLGAVFSDEPSLAQQRPLKRPRTDLGSLE